MPGGSAAFDIPFGMMDDGRGAIDARPPAMLGRPARLIPREPRCGAAAFAPIELRAPMLGRPLAALAFDGPSDWRIGMVGSLRRRRGVR